MDLVLTYVDNKDPQFIETYKSYKKPSGFNVDICRLRSYGLLNYWYRLVDKFMPFVDKIYLIVQSESQVPSTLNKSRLNIITHDQIIPSKYLPTYNSTTIELFMWRIPGLSEEFIYSNDDMFPISPLSSEDFFVGSKQCFRMKNFTYGMGNTFRNQVANSYNLIRSRYPKAEPSPMKPLHSMTTFKKSSCMKIFNLFKSEILRSISSYRTNTNYTQYLYMYDNYFSGDYIEHSPKYTYATIAQTIKLKNAINSGSKIVCINDDESPDFNYCIKCIKEVFDQLVPVKCKYEV